MMPTPPVEMPEDLQDFRVLSPPVVQNATGDSFSVAWAVSGCATGRVEWGLTPELGHTVVPAHHGLVALGDDMLSARVENISGGSVVYYRVVTRPVSYKSADSTVVGPPIRGEIRRLPLPRAEAGSCHLAVINDTHAHEDTVARLAEIIAQSDPEILLWNGDVVDFVDHPPVLARTTLTPGQERNDPASGGWASTRPLIYLPGNHDVRGRARTLPEALLPWPMQDEDPSGLAPTPGVRGRYCFAQRIGPIALIGLDTGEDKPDYRFGGLAAYEPYRQAQREWLGQALQNPGIASAPYLITICHIPLHGLPGHNDGTGPDGYAFYSGFGQKLWLPLLREAGCQAVVSGHMHVHRIDPPSEDFPLYQVVGGGPNKNDATLIRIEGDAGSLRITIENLDRQTVGTVRLVPRNT